MRPLDEVGIYDPAHPAEWLWEVRDIYATWSNQSMRAGIGRTAAWAEGMVSTVWPIPEAEFDNPAATDHFLNRDYNGTVSDRWR